MDEVTLDYWHAAMLVLVIVVVVVQVVRLVLDVT